MSGWKRIVILANSAKRHNPPALLDGGCLLCSEDKPHHCHPRLVADYLNRKWGCVRVTHLV